MTREQIADFMDFADSYVFAYCDDNQCEPADIALSCAYDMAVDILIHYITQYRLEYLKETNDELYHCYLSCVKFVQKYINDQTIDKNTRKWAQIWLDGAPEQ